MEFVSLSREEFSRFLSVLSYADAQTALRLYDSRERVRFLPSLVSYWSGKSCKFAQNLHQ